MMSFALLLPSPLHTPSYGLHCFPDICNSNQYRFINHPGEAKPNEVLVISLMTDRSLALNPKCRAILSGGTGRAEIIGFKGTVISCRGAVQNCNLKEIEEIISGSSPGEVDYKSSRKIDSPIGCVPLLKDRAVLPVYCGYGCSYQKCTFCGVRSGWIAPAEITCSIIRRANNLNSVAKLSIENPSESYLAELSELLCKEIADEKAARWSTYCRAGISDEIVSQMARSGCQSVVMGVEVFSDSALSTIKKGITVSQALHSMALFLRNGIRPTVSLIDFPSRIIGDQARKEAAVNLDKICQDPGFSDAHFVINKYIE